MRTFDRSPSASQAGMLAVALALPVMAVVAGCGSPPAGDSPVASAAPSAPPSVGGPTPVAGGGAGGDAVGPVTAVNVEFNPKALTAPADAPFTLVMDNQDDGVPHNIAVKDPNGGDIAVSEIVTGPAQVGLPVPALAAGSYTFICTIHPTMTGTITVE